MPYSEIEVKDLREKRYGLAEQANEVISTTAKEGRDLTDEERSKVDAIHDDIDALGKDIERRERQNEIQSQFEKTQGRAADLQSQSGEPVEKADGTDFDKQFRSWLLNENGSSKKFDINGAMVNQRSLNERLKIYREARNASEARKMWEEHRAQSTVNAEGGHTIPEDFHNVLETAMLAFGGMRQARTTIMRTASGAKLPMPTSNDTNNKGAIIAENTKIGEQDVAFDNVELDAYKYTSNAIRVSYELMQDSAFDMASWLGERLGERIGRITNEHFTTGTGVGQPTGIITAATVGHTAAAVNEITYQEMVDLLHSVDPAYRANSEFMFADSTLRELKKLTDTQGRPLWLPGVAVREADTFLGSRYVINQDVPGMAAGAKAVAFGDMSKYHIRDVMGVTLIRLDEVYAEWGQVAFLAFSRHDGNLLDAGTNPVKVLEMAAA